MRSAVTVCLVPEARLGPFVFHDDLEAACVKAAQLGFDAIELFPGSAEEVDARILRHILHRHGLNLAAVGTGAGWLRHKLTLTNPDAAVRHRAQQFVAAMVDFAGAFGAPVIVGSMQGRWEGDVSREQALAWLGQSIEQLGPRADALGARLFIEPLNRYESNVLNNVEQALAFLAPLRTRNVRILADLYHMNIEEASIPEALRQAGARLGHVHFADSNRRAIGFGHTNAAEVVATLKALGYDGYLSAEILPMPDSQAAARQTIESIKRLV